MFKIVDEIKTKFVHLDHPKGDDGEAALERERSEAQAYNAHRRGN